MIHLCISLSRFERTDDRPFIIVTRISFPIERINYRLEFIAFHNCHKYVINHPLSPFDGRSRRGNRRKSERREEEQVRFTYYTFNMNHDDDDDMVDTTHSFSVTLHLISDHKDTTKKNKLPSEGIDGVQVQYLLIGPSSWLIVVGQANLIALQRTKSIIMADEYTPKRKEFHSQNWDV